MRDSMKMTVGYQFGFMLLIQAAASAIVFLFGIVVFAYFLTMNIVKWLVSIALMAVNFAMLYIYSKRFANRDSKPYTPLKPSMVKGVMFGGVIAIINILLMVLLTLVWKLFPDASGAALVLRTVVNAVFYIWTFAYGGIMDLNNGSFTIISAIAMVIVPIAATTTGYIAGCRNFELAEKLDEFIYEKEDKNDE